MKPSLIFFGSFGHYSALVLDSLIQSELVTVIQVVTTPPHRDKKGHEQKNPVQLLAEAKNLPVMTRMPKSFTEIRDDFQADFIITAGYGKLLPASLLSQPKIAALNLHFSLLPKYRGANPGEWAILMDEKETGITVIEMNEEFDKGGTIFSASVPLSKYETRETVYEKLYTLGGEKLPQVIVNFQEGQLDVTPQPKTDLPYATRFTRDDGFIEWSALQQLLVGKTSALTMVSPLLAKIATLQHLTTIDASFVERACRALYGFPSVWTFIPTSKGDKRMKIHSCHLENDVLVLDEVQIEGQNKALWNQVKNIVTS